MNTNRRRFLLDCTLAAGSVLALNGQTPRRLTIRGAGGTFRLRLAERELLRGLAALYPAAEVRLAEVEADVALQVEPGRFQQPEAYEISNQGGRAVLAAPNEQALLYAVFEFLERQGAFFGTDGASYPFDPAPRMVLPAPGQPWTAKPRFAVRGLLPWPDFLNCITVYNEEDFRAYFEAMLRMRFNTFGMHVYTGANQWAESYLSFEYAGAGHLSYLDTSASNRWGYLPERTSRFGMGGGEFYDGEVFGSDATRFARDPWEQAERTRAMLRAGFDHAARLGIRTGIGFEPYQIPDEILRALPPEATDQKRPGARFDIDSVSARDMLEARLAQLLEAYPQVDYVWLWEDEQMNWESRKAGLPLAVTPFVQAHDFLRRHAPKKRLVLGGWGGVARNFAEFHKRLPEDIIFSCLGDSLGWDPTHEVFGKLESRERWPIPWLEDDPAMWLPQLHVHRFERDLNLAAQYGCQGVLGIHWRHRIVDPVAGYQARFSWDSGLKPAAYYHAYARSQAAGERGRKLGEILTEADRDQKLMATGTSQVQDGHVVTREYSGDYAQGFTPFWNDYDVPASLQESQKQVAAAVRGLADGAASPLERERLEYLTKHVEFLVPYAEAWNLAFRLHGILKEAAKLDKEAAREKVRREGVPLWLRLAPEVRRVMLLYQSIVATRNDLGQLASMQNKFVRLALVRLRLSMKEYLGELPRETEELFGQVTAPDPKAAPRVFIPTRPSLLARGEKVRVLIVAPGGAEPAVLHTRLRGEKSWTAHPAKLLGRRTFEAWLGPFSGPAEYVEYYAAAGKTTAPVCSATLV